MKPIIPFKALLIFLLIPLFTLATEKDKHNKEKTIKRSFNVNANAELHIDNSYGNLSIITWNENKIDIEVTITTSGDDQEKVQKKLDNITVEFKNTTNLVSAKTIFNKNNSWWNWSNNNVNMQINYVIKMPVTNSVNLNNDYGNIDLDKLEGRAIINCDYGKITTKELLANNNSFNFDYTKGCYFDYIKGGSINADYSDFTISKVENISINADYTNSEIEIAENVVYNNDYGSIKIDSVNNVDGDGDYLTVVIGDVYKNVSIVADYGSIKIGNITQNAGNIHIDTDYTGIKIGYDANYSFTFDFDLSYASLRGDENLQFSLKDKDGSDKKYKGYYGNSSNSGKIRVSSDYGSVTLNRN